MSCNGVLSSRLDKLNRVDDPRSLPEKKNKEYNNTRKKKVFIRLSYSTISRTIKHKKFLNKSR